MKVPVYEAPQVEARADVPAGITLAMPDNSALQHGIEAGADAFGKAVDRAQEQYAKDQARLQEQYEKWQHQARAADVANGLSQLTGKVTDAMNGAPVDPNAPPTVVGNTPPMFQPSDAAIDAATAAGPRTVPTNLSSPIDTGFLGLRGKAAAAAEPDVLKKLEAERQQIASSFADPETRLRFLERSQGLVLETRQRVGRHVSQQFEVAQQDAAANMSDAAVRAAAADPGNDSLAATVFGEAAGAVRGVGRGADFEALHDRALRADIAGTRIEALLSRNDVSSAERVLEANREVLGKQLDNYENRVKAARVNMNAATVANGIVDQSVAAVQDRPYQPPDKAVAEQLIASLPPEQQQHVAPIVASRITLLTEQAEKNKKNFTDKAVGIYNQNPAAFFTSDIGRTLNRVNAEKWRELHHEVVDFGLRAQALSKEAQKSQDDLAVDLVKAMSANDAATLNTDTFTAGRQLSETGKARVGQVVKAAQQTVNSKLAEPQDQFAQHAVDDVRQGFAPTPLTKGQREKAAQADKSTAARARDAFDAFVRKNGRPPTPGEALDLRAELVKGMTPRTSPAADLAGRAAANQVVGPPPTQRKVEIIDDQGNRALANETGIDAWLQAHPKWKRR